MIKTEFLSKLEDVQASYKTVYMWGSFGAPVTTALINEKSSQYPNWYTKERLDKLRDLIGMGYFSFDCVNLIKGILWGWKGDVTDPYGGAKYPYTPELKKLVEEGSLIPDISADMLINRCNSVSVDFSNIETGEVVWIKGHVGIYIGKGKVIECTPSWDNGVQISSINNIPLSSSKLSKNRTWDKHGKIPWITYTHNKDKKWNEIISYVSSSSDLWLNAINKINENIKNGDLEGLEIFQYFGPLIEKIYNLNYTGKLSWYHIIDRVSLMNGDWKTAIRALVGLAGAEGNIGSMEVFRFLPDLIVKIYEIDK